MPDARPGRAAVAVLMAAVAVVGSNSLALSPILTDVARDLGSTPAAVARAVAAHGAATGISAFLLGPRIDRIGPTAALRLGLACLVAAAAGSALSDRAVLLVAAQGCAGVGAGLVLPSAYALAAAYAPPGQGSRTLGRVLTGWSVSLVAGVPLAALAADAAGWRAAYWGIAALAAAALLGALRLPAVSGRPAESAPLRPLAPLRLPGVPALLGVCVAFMAAFYGVYAFLPDHVRTLHGVSAGRAGLMVLAYGCGFALAALADGRIDRGDPRRLYPRVLAAVALVYAAMPAVAAAGFAPIVALCAIWGFLNHFGLNILILLLTRASPAAPGAVLGLNSAVTYLAATGGVLAAGALGAAFGFAGLAGAACAALALAALVAQRAARPARPSGLSI